MTSENSKAVPDRLRELANWAAAHLEVVAARLKFFSLLGKASAQFVDLAPTDEADPHGVYARALEEATANPRVFNIALTGPYGSGKSSIIRTYLKRHPRSALHISLAAFLPDADDPKREVSKQEIERSILQQLLYGADADKLPLSRFKRIRTPGVWSKLRSLYILLGMASLVYSYTERAAISSGAYFHPFGPSNWLHLIVFGFAALFIWSAVNYFYVASFGVSLKSISLKNVELSPNAADQSSILNRHLDEIVYFFQSTDYKLVVVEDLDRFNNADIFVTLREINSLVNGYVGVTRRIQFLYALRDDMFANTDRTKFFEFIIPVIPIINSSNAIDMVLKQGKRLALEDRLDSQFLREVSRYLNDLRLISNIFNEYAIYEANLETDGDNSLDPNKLLAVLIYKNIYPRDFELLHRGEGELAKIFGQKEMLIVDAEQAYRTEIVQLEQDIQAAERQVPKDILELRSVYAMALIQKLPSPLSRVGTSRQTMVAVPDLTNQEAFDEIVSAQNLFLQWGQHNTLTQQNISELQSEVDGTATYAERAEAIKLKSQAGRDAAQRRINELRGKMKILRASKLNVLLRSYGSELTKGLNKLGDGGDLARFLLLEGHLDDSYYQYTSLFHSGRLSPNDNKFLRQIRAFITPDPDYPIDNVEEVIENMREEDFGVSYVLNVKLVDALLGDVGQLGRATKFLQFLMAEFTEKQDFFLAYYSSGERIKELLVGLAAASPQFMFMVMKSPIRDMHLARLLESAPAKLLGRLSEEHAELGEYLSKALPDIILQVEGLDPSKLEPLAIELEHLTAIEKHPLIAHALFESGKYRLSPENLEFIYVSILDRSDIEGLRRRHFTSLRESGSKPLLDRLEQEFEVYFTKVLSLSEDSNDEDLPALLELLSHNELDANKVESFVARQNAIFPSVEAVPEPYRAALFRIAKIEPTWENCMAFLRDATFDADSLIAFLGNEAVRTSLLKISVPDGDQALSLRNFLRGANAMPDDTYRDYVAALPNKAKSMPTELEDGKLRIIIEERGVVFNADNFIALEGDSDLQILFVATNIDSYLKSPGIVTVDDDFREQLLKEDLADEKKRAVIGLMDFAAFAGRPERAALIGPILARTNTDLEDIPFEASQAIILAAQPTRLQIALFNQLHEGMSVAQVRETLTMLPHPYSSITTGHGRPHLNNSEENRILAHWLARKNVISSSSKAWWGDDIVINLYKK